MTEPQLRELYVNTARNYLGVKEGTVTHCELVDAYNAHKPLARGYALKYTDDWCAGFVGAVAVLTGLTDLIPMEVSVPNMITLAESNGIWVENDAYVPLPGDILIYSWGDNGAGDCTTGASHVGIVECVQNGTIQVIEGNMSNQVGRRSIAVNGRYIRGFICPDYASIAVQGTGFVDVPEGSYYAEAVKWAVASGVTNGIDDAHFGPDTVCTRAQAVTMLWRAMGSPEPEDGYSPFADVQPAAYYAKAVQWAVQKGVTSGVDASHFAPDSPCTGGRLSHSCGGPRVSRRASLCTPRSTMWILRPGMQMRLRGHTERESPPGWTAATSGRMIIATGRRW